MKNMLSFILEVFLVALLGMPLSAQDNWASRNEALMAHKSGVFGYYVPSISHDKLFVEAHEEPFQLGTDYLIKLTVPDRLGGVRWIIRQKNGWMIRSKSSGLIVRDARCNNRVWEAEPIETEKVVTPPPVVPLGPPTPMVQTNIPPPPPLPPTRQEVLKENIGPVNQKSWVRRHPVLTGIGVALLSVGVYSATRHHGGNDSKKGAGDTIP